MKTIDLRIEGEDPVVGDLRIRLASKAILEQWVGLGANGSIERRDAYAKMLFPYDYWFDAVQFAQHMSSCALTVMALLRSLGHTNPLILKPYAKQIGMAVADLVAIARQENALCVKDFSATIMPSEVLIVGGTHGQLEHVITVIDWHSDLEADGTEVNVLDTIEGGQADDGRSGNIQKKMRAWTHHEDRGYFTVDTWHDDTKTVSTGRTLSFAFDLTKLTYANKASVPDDFDT